MATSIDKRTAKLMIDRLNKELDDLFLMQESSKKNKGRLNRDTNLAADYGITVPEFEPMYKNIIPVDPTKNVVSNQIAPIDLGFLNPSKIDTSRLANMKKAEPVDYGIAGGINDFFYKNKWSPNYFLNNKETFNNLAQIAPVIGNLAAMFDSNKGLMANDFYNPKANEVASLMRNRRVNVDPALEQILNSERIGNYNIRNVARTPGEYMGNISAVTNQAMRNRASVMANKQNMDLQMKGEEAQMLQQEGMHRAGVNWNVMDWNKSADATRRNIFRTGLSQLSQWAQLKELQENTALRDEEKIMILKDIFGQILPFWDTLNNIKIK